MKALLIINKLVLYLVIALTISYFEVPTLVILIFHLVAPVILIALDVKNKLNFRYIATSIMMADIAFGLFTDISITLPYLYFFALPMWAFPSLTEKNQNWFIEMFKPIVNTTNWVQDLHGVFCLTVLVLTTALSWPFVHFSILDTIYNDDNQDNYLTTIGNNMGGWGIPSEFSKPFDRVMPYDDWDRQMGQLDHKSIKRAIKELTPSYQGIHYEGRMYLERKILIKILKVEFNETYQE